MDSLLPAAAMDLTQSDEEERQKKQPRCGDCPHECSRSAAAQVAPQLAGATAIIDPPVSEPRHSDGSRDWYRAKPYWDTVKAAFADLGLHSVHTYTGGENNCLAYAYMVGSGDVDQRAQRCAPSARMHS